MQSNSYQVSVRTGADGFRTDIQAGQHALVADEPERLGGTDAGPDPYAYLLAALGSCTSMTLRMYADRKQWPLHSVEVQLSHRRAHASDCAECESASGYVDVIERVIHLRGPLDEAQRERLLRIAERCPVQLTLSREIRINTSVQGGAP